MHPSSKALILFMRYPDPGKVKSRLATVVGKEEAARIYEKLLRSALGVVADFKQERPSVHVCLAFTPEDKKGLIEQAYPGPWELVPQVGAHLGERMRRAVLDLMGRGFSHVVLTGSDIADLRAGDFRKAFDALDHGRAVLGPAADGGFYLIGLDRPCPSVFEPETWGTSDVFARTESLLRDAGLRVFSLDRRQDIDRPEDIVRLKEDPAFNARLSIIIPTLRPVEELERRLLVPLQSRLWPDDEIVVVRGAVEGGGQAPREHGPRIRCVTSPVGRGIQLNRGAEVARGDIFLFLHDDCTPPPHVCHAVRRICHAPRASLGCFRLAFSPSSRPIDMIARWANTRARFFKLPYGDQGLFIRREVFEAMGGFKKPFLMEDVDLVQRARRWGNLLMCQEEMLASPNRYLRRGILRASMLNHVTMLLYFLGVDDRKLYSLYYGS